MVESFDELTKPNMSFKGFTFVRQASLAQTKKGDPFYHLTLAKKSTHIPAKVWSDQLNGREDEAQQTLKEGNLIYIEGDTSTYNDSLQMTVRFFRTAKEDEVNLEDFLETPPEPIQELTVEFERYLEEIKDPLIQTISTAIYKKYKSHFVKYPAAVSNHHSFTGGLLYHSVCMIRLGKDICKHYPSVNQDFIIAGIALHDAAKVMEYTNFSAPSYSLPGEFIGHISMSSMLVDREVQIITKERGQPLSSYEHEAVYQLQHCILSHHGKQEWGSPVEPKTLEAHLIHLIDMIDSRVNMIDRGLDQAPEGEFTKVFPLGKLFKPHSK
ncbi:3'-5' exoribonuclease YhaM family protein [Salisediminibacterium selenitireducens]|uniref:Metal dependent phosphohydrolase n=1 Tax=Bacillus selenitireducens (strain ATCC 700615 / DSM 15326 / MLS10) TaxID=439292 RepID=D6XW63_BACIE|nr:HD domain-containing protein [Salisediminibacterium selenitireducens]ADH99817.1 metal dependent phosphohydrolase [[Bacillus] selenitireducens MLS10]